MGGWEGLLHVQSLWRGQDLPHSMFLKSAGKSLHRIFSSVYHLPGTLPGPGDPLFVSIATEASVIIAVGCQ